MPSAARLGDYIIQNGPHCHATMHPPFPMPTPVPHPPLPLAILTGAATVMIDGKPAARVSDNSALCSLPSCVPGGPGMIALGSMNVMIETLPAARVNDMTLHSSCIMPIPAPTGRILPPCSTTVIIGG